MTATRKQTGDVTIPAIVVEAAGADGWLSIEATLTEWSAEMGVIVTGLAVFGAVVLGVWAVIVLGIVIVEVWYRAFLRRRDRRDVADAAAWREIHGRVRDGLGPGEET